MTEIYERGFIQATFLVYEDFPNYKSGVYKYSTWELMGDILLKLLDGEVKMEWNIDYVLIHGMNIGVIMVLSKY